MARPPQNPLAPGIFLRGKTFWLRHSVEGKQARISLGTSDYPEAIRLADQLRGKATSHQEEKTNSWDEALSKYLREKENKGKFRRGRKTSETVLFACRSFQLWGGYAEPGAVPENALNDYYQAKTGVLAESTLLGYVAKVSTFLRWAGVTLTALDLEDPAQPSQKTVIGWDQWEKLIDDCKREDLRFILFAGFQAGMRKDEIVMARPQWFDLKTKVIKIPSTDPVTGWQTKSKRFRKIPILTDKFLDFLKDFLKPAAPFVLHPEARSGKSRYRWDFRLPFRQFMVSQGLPDFSPHCMRHSFITHLCKRGVPLPLVSAWSGDRIKTIESNYWHAGASDEAVALASSNLSLEEKLKRTIISIIGPERKETSYEWTKTAPKPHTRKYSVADTIGSRSIMAFLIDPGDGTYGDVIPEEDWEEGALSTERARLALLEEQGYIERK